MWSTLARNTSTFMIVASNFFVAGFCPFTYHSNESNNLNITGNKKIARRHPEGASQDEGSSDEILRRALGGKAGAVTM